MESPQYSCSNNDIDMVRTVMRRRSQGAGDNPSRSTVEFYDHLASDYDALRFGNFKNQVGQVSEERILDDLMDDVFGTNLLDVGSGTGRIARLMVKRFPHITLAEPARGMIATLTASPDLALCRIVSAEVEHLPFRDSTFDVITCIRVIWHLAEPQKGIVELARVLKPGGYLLFDFLNPISLTHVMHRIRGSEVPMVFTSLRTILGYLRESPLTPTCHEPHRSPFLQLLPRRLMLTGKWTTPFLKIEGLLRRMPFPRSTLCLIVARKSAR